MNEESGRAPSRRWFQPDFYTLAGFLMFLIMGVFEWRGYVRKHEGIYLLGSRRISDPDFLPGDLTWSVLPPTTFLYDHLLAPLWGVFDDFGIVTIGRLVTWFLLAWSLALLARTVRLPAWSVVAGTTLWLLWEQTLASCGSPLEGFQPKSTAYPLVLFSIAFAIRGQVVRAGATAGLATVFHIIIGGWGCLALFLSMLVNRKFFSWRQLFLFLLATAPFTLPLVLVVGFFHAGGLSGAERALMDEIYVTFAQPHCVDPDFFMGTTRWVRVFLLLPVAPLLIWFWPRVRAARILSVFVAMLAVFFGLGMLANAFDAHWFMKIYPFQVGNSLPALLLFTVCLAFAGKYWPERRPVQAVWILAIAASVWLLADRDVLTERVPEVSRTFLGSLEREDPETSRYGRRITSSRRDLYKWIRGNTPARSVFITPYLPEFWIYTGRDQVASFRHPPHDSKIIEWKTRLEALNGFKPFDGRGFEITDELTYGERTLPVADIIRIRDLYGATHYVTNRRRGDLSAHLRHCAGKYCVFDVIGMRDEG